MGSKYSLISEFVVDEHIDLMAITEIWFINNDYATINQFVLQIHHKLYGSFTTFEQLAVN